MTSSVTTGRAGRGESTVGGPLPYSGRKADADALEREFAESVMRECKEARRRQRARTHEKIRQIPEGAVLAVAVLGGAAMTAFMLVTRGVSSTIAMDTGAALVAMFVGGNDVRKSIALKEPAWRKRHKIISWLLRRHPLD